MLFRSPRIQLVARLLEGDGAVRALLVPGAFEERPPRWIRGRLYRYEFTARGEQGWWRRTLISEYLPPLSATSPELKDFLDRAPEW